MAMVVMVHKQHLCFNKRNYSRHKDSKTNVTKQEIKVETIYKKNAKFNLRVQLQLQGI